MSRRHPMGTGWPGPGPWTAAGRWYAGRRTRPMRPRCCSRPAAASPTWCGRPLGSSGSSRSEEHTSELQSQSNLVCRLLLEKKKKTYIQCNHITVGYSHLISSFTMPVELNIDLPLSQYV